MRTIKASDRITETVMKIDAYQSNRAGAKTPEELENNLRECERLTKLVGEYVCIALLRDVRKEQGLPVYVPKK